VKRRLSGEPEGGGKPHFSGSFDGLRIAVIQLKG
jgi:hypothetical protein